MKPHNRDEFLMGLLVTGFCLWCLLCCIVGAFIAWKVSWGSFLLIAPISAIGAVIWLFILRRCVWGLWEIWRE